MRNKIWPLYLRAEEVLTQMGGGNPSSLHSPNYQGAAVNGISSVSSHEHLRRDIAANTNIKLFFLFIYLFLILLE